MRSNYYNNHRYNRNSYRSEYIARTAVVRRQKLILLCLFLVSVIISNFIFSIKVNANNKKPSAETVKMYKSIMVYAGDTLESIAEEYMSDEYASEIKYIKEVSSINGFSSDTSLIPGNKIIVPYYMSKSISNNPVIEISLSN